MLNIPAAHATDASYKNMSAEQQAEHMRPNTKPKGPLSVSDICMGVFWGLWLYSASAAIVYFLVEAITHS